LGLIRVSGIIGLCVVCLWNASCLKAAGVRYPGLPTLDDGALHVINFDVGQADALLIMYRGKSLMVDCGAPKSQPLKASRVVPRRLDALLGSRHIDYFVTTHYHQDHLGAPGNRRNRRDPMGLFSLIERDGLTIGTLVDRGFWFIGKKGATQKSYEKAVGRWLKKGIAKRRRIVKPGDTIDMGQGLDVKVLSAAGNGVLGRMESLYPDFITTARPSENDYSVGLKITLGDFEMFSAGDLSGKNVVRIHGPSKESYTDIETRIYREVGPIEFYRVNHHGSRHSTNPCFAQTLRPQVSVFSTGYNKYGHPDPGVYTALKRYGDVYITGGVDPRRERHIDKADIVGDDVEVLVAGDGGRFWVNGKEYRSRNDQDELAEPLGEMPLCDKISPKMTPKLYHVDGGSGSSED
jgi:beta-lactamase superfamily II metal-dependent hydrolase